MVSKSETSLTLAIRAIEKCLEHSCYNPYDIQVVISCNISKIDHDNKVLVSPSYSIQLKKHFGMDNALTFDINNACAGSLTGIYILESLLKSGVVSNGLIVSGEYITHLAKTAQNEITSLKDDRMACLTLGDAGVATILDLDSNEGEGFLAMNLFTEKGAHHCKAFPTLNVEGGIIMHTNSAKIFEDSSRLNEISLRNILEQSGLNSLKKVDHIIMHQVSSKGFQTYLDSANRVLKKDQIELDKLIQNIEQNGNSASTSHLLALDQNLQDRKIKKDQNILFTVQASGVVIGSFLYKLVSHPYDTIELKKEKRNIKRRRLMVSEPKVKVKNVCYSKLGGSIEDIKSTIIKALNTSSLDNVEALIYTGMIKPDFLFEPAFGSILSEASRLNNGLEHLAFDLTNDNLGWLSAVFILSQLSLNNKTYEAIISTSFLNEDKVTGDNSATVIERSSNKQNGICQFYFRDFTEFIQNKSTFIHCNGNETALQKLTSQDYETKLFQCIENTCNEYLNISKTKVEDYKFVLLPSWSVSLRKRLENQLNITESQRIDIGAFSELSSSNIPAHLSIAIQKTKSGDRILIIESCPGIQVGIAVYLV